MCVYKYTVIYLFIYVYICVCDVCVKGSCTHVIDRSLTILHKK